MFVGAVQGDGFSQLCFPCILHCFPAMGISDLKIPILVKGKGVVSNAAISVWLFSCFIFFNLKIAFNIFKAEP